ncbi:hypothetical protein MAQ58_25115, partial [Enterobacter sp. DRP3]|nr:hypothetical protein [Enterobacter sp. DRP3]
MEMVDPGGSRDAAAVSAAMSFTLTSNEQSSVMLPGKKGVPRGIKDIDEGRPNGSARGLCTAKRVQPLACCAT